jgi:hypothetical protein
MKYVIIVAPMTDNTKVAYPFLFSEAINHKAAAEHFKHLLLWQSDAGTIPRLRDVVVHSAGFFSPEYGAQRGSESLGILREEIADAGSKEDDFIICVNDQTKGILR